MSGPNDEAATIRAIRELLMVLKKRPISEQPRTGLLDPKHSWVKEAMQRKANQSW